jgi:hypothetical protein
VSRRALRRFVVVVAAAGAIDLASEAKADAPKTQYGYFGPYDVVIMDQHTGLTWQRGFGQVADFEGAASYCQGLSLPGGWRAPSYKELLTLVDENPHMSFFTGTPLAAAIDEHAFPETPTDQHYWTSSVAVGGGRYTVAFSDGTVQIESPEVPSYYVRCVQSAAP